MPKTNPPSKDDSHDTLPPSGSARLAAQRRPSPSGVLMAVLALILGGVGLWLYMRRVFAGERLTLTDAALPLLAMAPAYLASRWLRPTHPLGLFAALVLSLCGVSLLAMPIQRWQHGVTEARLAALEKQADDARVVQAELVRKLNLYFSDLESDTERAQYLTQLYGDGSEENVWTCRLLLAQTEDPFMVAGLAALLRQDAEIPLDLNAVDFVALPPSERDAALKPIDDWLEAQDAASPRD